MLLWFLLLGPTEALAVRGHVFTGKTIGSPCEPISEPICAPGKLKEPTGLAVSEATTGPAAGDVYVVDKGNNRVQRFNAEGVFRDEIKGPSGEGTGTLSENKKTITSALAEHGVFIVGEQIEGEGIPSGTEIIAVPSPGTLELSNAVEAGKSKIGVALTAHQQFAAPEGIAIDNACALHKPELTETTVPKCSEFDPSAGDVYVVDNRPGEGPHEESLKAVDKFSPTGEYLGQITENPEGEFAALGFHQLFGVAVGVTGEVWVAEENFGSVPQGAAAYGHGAANGFLEFREIPGEHPLYPGPGLAVDAQRDLFLNTGRQLFGEQLGVVELPGAGGEPKGLEQQPASGVALEASSGDPYIDLEGSISRLSSGLEPLETLGEGILRSGSGVAVSSRAETVLVADAEANVVDVFASEPIGRPTVTDEPAGAVASSSAVLTGTVNPRGGAATTWRFQYGPCATSATCSTSDYPSETSPGSLPLDFNAHAVSVTLEGLVPNTAYHFRLLAENHEGETTGQERVFTTQAGASAYTLLDARRWEMVSPPNKYGAQLISLHQTSVIQAAAAGGALAYVATTPTEPEPQANPSVTSVLSTRGAGGWSSRDVDPPIYGGAVGVQVGHTVEYDLFSEDLSLGALQPQGDFPPPGSPQSLSSEATEQTVFLRNPASGASLPLVTRANDTAEPFEPFGVIGSSGAPCGPSPSPFCGPAFVAASPDLSHVVFSSRVALTPKPLPPGLGATSLYEWSSAVSPSTPLQQINLLPRENGEEAVAPDASLGERTAGAVSADGRVVWSTPEHLYVRDVARGETVQLDVPEGEPAAAPKPRFRFASRDGSRVLFTDQQPLTSASGEDDLYECDLVEGPAGLRCELHDLTPITAGEQARVQGGVVAASSDGTWVYFVANGVLGDGAVHGTCKAAPEDSATQRCNLYVHHAGATRLVTVLSGADYPVWSGSLTSRASSDGEWLAFMSALPLTGYDNRDAHSGQPDQEVYLYHASALTLACASCDPTGARPVGREHIEATLAGGGTTDYTEHTWFAAELPRPSGFEIGNPDYQARYLSNAGRLFFDANDALVGQDANATGDVYEYEPEGEGGEAERCGPTSTGANIAFKPENTYTAETGQGTESAACVGLISSGGGSESVFLDASENGSDTFFLTADKLAPQDTDTSLDVYDAHICTTASPCSAPVGPETACESADACRAAPTPQPGVFGSPASDTLAGPASAAPPPPKHKTAAEERAERLGKALRACKHRYPHRKHKRQACERAAHKAYGAKRAAKKASRARATNDRRASR